MHHVAPQADRTLFILHCKHATAVLLLLNVHAPLLNAALSNFAGHLPASVSHSVSTMKCMQVLGFNRAYRSCRSRHKDFLCPSFSQSMWIVSVLNDPRSTWFRESIHLREVLLVAFQLWWRVLDSHQQHLHGGKAGKWCMAMGHLQDGDPKRPDVGQLIVSARGLQPVQAEILQLHGDNANDGDLARVR